jgi:magnesium chelatase family protein
MASSHAILNRNLIITEGRGAILVARALKCAASVQDLARQTESDRAALYALAGLCGSRDTVAAPLRAPHHTCSIVGLTGTVTNGYRVRPGELSLAHGGVLYVEHAGEFARSNMTAILDAVSHGAVRVGSAGSYVTLPAQFRLVFDCRDQTDRTARIRADFADYTIETTVAEAQAVLADAGLWENNP